jgi:predicted PurR-regulated permease PerM
MDNLQHPSYPQKSIETVLRVGAVLLLIATCFMILSPFAMIILWALIISISLNPIYKKLTHWLGGRPKTAAVIIAITGLAVIIVPTILLSESIIVAAKHLSVQLEAGTLSIPYPPENVQTWPLVGEKIFALWSAAANNFEATVGQYGAEIKTVAKSFLAAAAGFGGAMLQFTAAIIIAAIFLANGEGGVSNTRKLFVRLAGEKGAGFTDLAGETVRSVAAGVLGVALIQALLTAIGFVVMGIPLAGLWALAVLVLAIVQLPAMLVVAPIIVYAYATADTTSASIFTVYMLLAGASDNILKPLLMGRGSSVPVLVILMGAIGGMIMSGIIGLFVGSVILALGYELLIAWLNDDPQRPEPSGGE